MVLNTADHDNLHGVVSTRKRISILYKISHIKFLCVCVCVCRGGGAFEEGRLDENVLGIQFYKEDYDSHNIYSVKHTHFVVLTVLMNKNHYIQM